MDNLFIAASASSPEVDFRFDERRLSLKGESYPENAAQFWGEIIATLRRFLAEDQVGTTITVNVALAYFNSSSTKMLFNIIEALNHAVETGNTVIVHWFHDEEDDTMLEFGQDLRADFPAIEFITEAVKSG